MAIPEPTADDLARDAVADWQAIHDAFGHLLDNSCRPWALAWISRAASLAKRVEELEADNATLTASSESLCIALEGEGAQRCAEQLLAKQRIAELEAIIAAWESTNTGDLSRRCKKLEVENAKLREQARTAWLDAREAAAKRIESCAAALLESADEPGRDVGVAWALADVRPLLSAAAAIRAMQPPGETEVKHG